VNDLVDAAIQSPLQPMVPSISMMSPRTRFSREVFLRFEMSVEATVRGAGGTHDLRYCDSIETMKPEEFAGDIHDLFSAGSSPVA
jgi:hypothetical protein